MLLFLDTETTGLTSQDQILEVAGFLTDDDGLNAREHFREVIGLTARGNDRLYDDAYVRGMHRKSGLLDELPKLWDSEYTVKMNQLLDHIKKLTNSRTQLAGFSVHFDAKMLLNAWRQYDWKSATGMSFRYLDVSSVVRAVKEATGIDCRPATDVVHRAMDDAEAARLTYVACLQVMRERHVIS